MIAKGKKELEITIAVANDTCIIYRVVIEV